MLQIILAWYSPTPTTLTFSWRRSLSYENQSIDLRTKSMDWFLYDNGFRHERANDQISQKVWKSFVDVPLSINFIGMYHL